MTAMRALLALALLPAPALAADTYALTPAEIARIQDANDRGDPSPVLDTTPRRDRRVHGEAGFVAGTGGLVGGYVTAFAPLGENGVAAISVSQFTADRPRRR